MSNHTVSFRTYVNVILALFLLTVCTVLVSLVDFGWMNAIIAIGIATVKAYLVLMYFMHLKYDDKTYLIIFLTGVFFLFLIFVFIAFDISTRVVETNVL